MARRHRHREQESISGSARPQLPRHGGTREDFDPGIQENPFVCHEYTMRDRTLRTEFFDEKLFGTVFEEFSGTTVDRLSRTR